VVRRWESDSLRRSHRHRRCQGCGQGNRSNSVGFEERREPRTRLRDNCSLSLIYYVAHARRDEFGSDN